MKKNLLFCCLLISALFFSRKSYSLNRHVYVVGNQVFCHGDSSYLSASAGCYTNCPLTAYQWYLNANPIAGATGQFYTTVTPGLYSCNVTMPTCYVYTTDTVVSGMTDTLRVYGEIGATFSLISDSSLCYGDTLKIIASKTGPGAAFSLNYPYSSLSTIAYTCLYSNYNNIGDKLIDTLEMAYLPHGNTCADSNSVTVNFEYVRSYCSYTPHLTCATRTFHINRLDQKIPLTVSGSNPFCSGDTLHLVAGTLYNLPGQTCQWERNNSNVNGATNPTYSANLNGAYYAVVNYQQGCSANSDTVNVTVNPSPQPTVTLVSGNLWQVSQSFIDYQWYRNDTLIAGANQSSLTVGNGNATDYWYVIVTDANGCTGKSNLIALASGFANMGVDAYHIYPNPAANQLTITGITPKTELTLTNLLGETLYKTIAQKATETIDVSKLPAGVYFLNHLKFMKQ